MMFERNRILIVIITLLSLFCSCAKEGNLTMEISSSYKEESVVTTSQTETSSKNSSKSTVDRISPSESASETQTSSESASETQTSSKQKEDVSEYAFGIRLASESETIFHTITKTYADEEMKEIVNMRDIESLNEKYPTEHLRKWKMGETLCYRAVYFGEKKTAVLFFEADGSKAMLTRFLEPQGYKADFEKLSVGERFGKVEELYPGGLYSTIFSSRLDREFSNHITKDGYYVDIYYVSGQSTMFSDYTISDVMIDLL